MRKERKKEQRKERKSKEGEKEGKEGGKQDVGRARWGFLFLFFCSEPGGVGGRKGVVCV